MKVFAPIGEVAVVNGEGGLWCLSVNKEPKNAKAARANEVGSKSLVVARDEAWRSVIHNGAGKVLAEVFHVSDGSGGELAGPEARAMVPVLAAAPALFGKARALADAIFRHHSERCKNVPMGFVREWAELNEALAKLEREVAFVSGSESEVAA